MTNRLQVFASLLANFELSTSAIVGLKKTGITAFKWYLKSDVRFSRITNANLANLAKLLQPQGLRRLRTIANYCELRELKHCHIKNSTTVKTVSLKTCTTVLLVSLLATCQPSYAITKSYPIQISDNNVSLDKVAVSGNYGRQELRKLCKTVQHHTIVDVFLCLFFANLSVMGELRLAALWWGGRANKPFIRRIPRAVVLRFSSLPAALHLGQLKTKPNQTKPTPLICVKPFVNQPKTPVNEAQTDSGGFYEYLNRRKSKGHDAQTSQPFKH